MQPRIRLAFWAASAHCHIMLSFTSTSKSQVLLLGAALNPFSAQAVFVLGVALAQVQDLALGLVELLEVCMGPLLKSVKIPLDGISSLQCVSCTTQLGVIGRLAEGALNLPVQVANKDVKQRWTQY